MWYVSRQFKGFELQQRFWTVVDLTSDNQQLAKYMHVSYDSNIDLYLS